MSGELFPQILYEDPHVIVLSKPAGLLSQGDRSGDASLIEWLRVHVGCSYIGLVHRLDRNTSGIMVVAKRSKAADRLTAALKKGLVKRTYLGWVLGEVREAQTWRDWLLKSEGENQSRVVEEKIAGAKPAVTHTKPLRAGRWKDQRLTLLEFQLETGRSHQIRVQAAHHGHPILGDRKYGKAHLFPRPALHAWRLRLPHPMGGKMLEWEAPLPPDFSWIGPVKGAR